MAFVQDVSATGFVTTLAAGAMTVTAGNTLTVTLNTVQATTMATGLSGNGNTYVLGTISANNGGFYQHVYYVMSAAGGSTNVTANGGTNDVFAIHVREDSGLTAFAGASSYAGSPSGTTANAIITGNITFSGGGVIMGCVADTTQVGSTVSANTPSVGSNLTYTSRALAWGANPYWGSAVDSPIASAGNYAVAWTGVNPYAFDGFVAAAIGYLTGAAPPVPSFGPMPKQLYVMP